MESDAPALGTAEDAKAGKLSFVVGGSEAAVERCRPIFEALTNEFCVHQAERLSDALFAASRYWSIELQPSKGLAGAPAEVLAAARDTATNPAVLDAFALAIVAGRGPPAYPGIAGHAPDLARARRDVNAIAHATGELRKLVPNPGSYVSESDFFEKDWQHAFWGENYPRLRAVKAKYDPEGLFFVHHGVGSEDWSDDGFERRAAN